MEREEFINNIISILHKNGNKIFLVGQYLFLHSKETLCPRYVSVDENDTIFVSCGLFEPTEEDEERFNHFETFDKIQEYWKLERNIKKLTMKDLSNEDLKLIYDLILENS